MTRPRTAVTTGAAAAALAALLLGLPAPAPGRAVPQDPDPAKPRRNVAVLIHEGVELLDFAGPGEVFAAAGRGRAFRVYTVAATREPITSQRFVKVTPEFT